jgi:DNA repair protein RadA/Sms
MAKTRTLHRCTECGSSSPRWAGRCGSCGEWNSLVEESREASAAPPGGSLPPPGIPVPVSEVVDDSIGLRPSGVAEFDRVLGGGLVPGSVTLVGGEPGIGKSTLLLQVAAASAARGCRVLYMSGEESPTQVRARASRLGALHDDLWLVSETVLPHLVGHLDRVQPDLVVVDSVQTLHDPVLGSAPGSVTQVRECAHGLVREAKHRGLAMLLVGHVTKDGALAGPRLLEHVVDTVVSFEGDRHHALRLLRAVKHRYGPTAELGLLEMSDDGLTEVTDPSEMFLADRMTGISGSAVVPTMDGGRPLLVEVQALVADSDLAHPRRTAQGLDHGRLALLLAVLDRRVGLKSAKQDVHALAVGGVRVADPGADMALALAVASSLTDQTLPDDLVAMGEVGLGGEIRHVVHTERRLAEAARRGFARALVPRATPDVLGVELLRVPTLAAAVALAGDGRM